MAFMAWAPSRSSCNARAGDDAAEAEFFPVEHLPHLAFDHLKASERERVRRERARKNASEDPLFT